MTLALLPLAIALGLSPAPQDDRVAAWEEDLVYLIGRIEDLHPDPMFGITQDEFDQAIDEVYVGLTERTDDQIVCSFMKFVATLAKNGRDGHSGVWPGPVFRYLPLRLYRFDDGWFVVDARDDADLVGARVVTVGGNPIGDVRDEVAPLLTRDNDSNLLGRMPLALVMPELLHALGITPERDRVPLGLVLPSGEGREVVLEGISFGAYRAWSPAPAAFLPPRAGACWLEPPADAAYCMTVLEPDKTLFVQYGEVQGTNRRGESMADFAGRLIRTFEERGLERVVLDLRRNGGGNNGTFGPLIQALRDHAAVNRRGALFALTGRATFSAAGNFVTSLENETEALLVGEDTGGAPNQYGDARTVTLPNHPELLVRISTVYHVFAEPDDPRLTHAPDLPVEYTSADYFAGRDPVLRRALEYTE